VSAKDKGTGKEQKITIQGSSGLSDAEVEKMRKEAQEHETEDQKRAGLIEARNAADNLIYTSEKTLKDAGDKVSESDKQDVDEKIKALRETMGADDLDAIKQKTDELSEAIQKIGAAMYQQGGGTEQGGPDQSGGEDEGVDYTTTADQSDSDTSGGDAAAGAESGSGETGSEAESKDGSKQSDAPDDDGKK
ncbi:MAG: Hsp70 family protein, partial [Patescibacteria group bacterium]